MDSNEGFLEEVFEDNKSSLNLTIRPLIIWVFVLMVSGGMIFYRINGGLPLFYIALSVLFGNSISWVRHYKWKSIIVNVIFLFSIMLMTFLCTQRFFVDQYYYISSEGSVILLSISAISLFIYEFYKRYLINDQLNSEFEFTIGKRNSSVLATVVIGLFFILLGTFICYIAGYGGILLVIIGAVIIFSSEGYDIQASRKQIRHYKKYFLFKTGKWETYTSDFFLKLEPLESSEDSYRLKLKPKSASVKQEIHLFLIDQSTSDVKLIYRFIKSEYPFKEAQDLADKMGIPLKK
ncbi:MAG: hypothetical protein AB8B61_10535 [Cyclobacteriaceae bacterium]